MRCAPLLELRTEQGPDLRGMHPVGEKIVPLPVCRRVLEGKKTNLWLLAFANCEMSSLPKTEVGAYRQSLKVYARMPNPTKVVWGLLPKKN